MKTPFFELHCHYYSLNVCREDLYCTPGEVCGIVSEVFFEKCSGVRYLNFKLFVYRAIRIHHAHKICQTPLARRDLSTDCLSLFLRKENLKFNHGKWAWSV